MKTSRDVRRVAFAGAVLSSAILPGLAWAQAGPEGPAEGDQGAAAPGPGSGGGAAPAPPATPPMNQPMLGYGVPQSANGTIGGGNATESSSHPVTGDEEDSFDNGRSHAGSGSSRGDKNGPVFVGRPSSMTAEAPDTHVVRRGDTLWALCDSYFQNPYQWPRLWSYNPQIRNPHWIFPGDELRLKEGAGAGESTASSSAGPAPSKTMGTSRDGLSLVDRRRQVPRGTVFLRDAGWVHDQTDEVWGAVSGSDQDKMFLSDGDELYLSVNGGHDVKLGQELSIFRPRTSAAAGQIVQILGTARIDQWSPQDRIARAKIVESLDTIERGSLVGPIARRFEIVAPRRNDVDLQAHVLASLHPNVFFGQDQVVFIDKGEAAGLKPGNRLFIVRRGDAWRRSLVTPAAGYRVSPDDENPMPPLEKTPGAKVDQDRYPDEVTAELRVLAVKKDSAVCIVSQAKLEIELGDLVVARKGY